MHYFVSYIYRYLFPMPKFFCLLLLIILQSGVKGQDIANEDLLKSNQLYKAGDTATVLQILTNGGNYQGVFLDSALLYSEKALSISKKIKFEKGEIYALNLEGAVMVKLGNYTKGLETFLEALQIAERVNFARGRAMVLTNLGDLYFKQGELKKALNYAQQAKQISELIADTLNISASYLNIGNAYEALNLLDSARINTQLAYEFAAKVHIAKDTSDAQNYLGTALNNLGNINAKAKQNNLAIEYYRLSFPYFIKTEDYDGLCESYLGSAKVFKEVGNPDSSLFYAKKSYNTAVSQGFLKFVLDASTFISKYFQGRNQIDSAFAYQQIMITAKDSLFSQEKVKQLQSLTINETLRQQELANERLREAEERKNNLQYIAIAAFIFLFVLSIILVSRRRIKLTTINFMVTVALLLVFEYISLFLHPYISLWTHHSPVYMLLILVAIASILVPGHHRLEHWIKETLAHKIIQPRTRKITVHKPED